MKASNISTPHAFTTRFGGVSSGIYKSLNLGSKMDDDPENVIENYSRLCKCLDISIDDIVCSTQVHGTHIRTVTRDDCGKLFAPGRQQADGLISAAPGAALMVFTADCVPVLLYDPILNVTGAVHAGWRGTVANIAGIAVKRMSDEFGCSPFNIKAAIGPCISKCCFETNKDVTDVLYAVIPDNAENCISLKINDHNNKYMVDLKKANRILLEKAGIADISISNDCTSCSGDKYWSHRKSNGQRGSQAAIIKTPDR